MCLTLTLLFTLTQTYKDGVSQMGIDRSRGRWKADEINHFNVLKLKAIFTGVQTYCQGKNYKYVRVMPDNITATSYVNNKEVIKSEFYDKIAKELLVW